MPAIPIIIYMAVDVAAEYVIADVIASAVADTVLASSAGIIQRVLLALLVALPLPQQRAGMLGKALYLGRLVVLPEHTLAGKSVPSFKER